MDAERPLTAKGVGIARAMAARLARQKRYRPMVIWSSPYLRARQTAEHLRAGLGVGMQCQIHEALTPYAEPTAILAQLIRLEQTVCIVGHNPHLSLLAAVLIAGPRKPPFLHFKKGAILVLESPQPGTLAFRVEAYLTPEK